MSNARTWVRWIQYGAFGLFLAGLAIIGFAGGGGARGALATAEALVLGVALAAAQLDERQGLEREQPEACGTGRCEVRVTRLHLAPVGVQPCRPGRRIQPFQGRLFRAIQLTQTRVQLVQQVVHRQALRCAHARGPQDRRGFFARGLARPVNQVPDGRRDFAAKQLVGIGSGQQVHQTAWGASSRSTGTPPSRWLLKISATSASVTLRYITASG